HGERCLFVLVGWLLLAPTRFVLAAQPVGSVRPKRVIGISRVWIPRPVDVFRARWTLGPPAVSEHWAGCGNSPARTIDRPTSEQRGGTTHQTVATDVGSA